MLDAITASQQAAFQLRGSLFTLSVLQLLDNDLDKIDRELKLLVHRTPKFFEHAPIVIDLQKMEQHDESIDFDTLASHLRKHQLIPVGVRGGTQTQNDEAKTAGLAVLSLAKTEEPQLATRQKESADSKKSKDKKDKSAEQVSIVVTKPVRSGQQIYAKNTDLIVVAPVSQGAELLADGNIHIYGPLRGRALAGISGNTQARIFCHSMEAELVSIAGHYVVNDALIKQHRNIPQQIYLVDGKLKITPLTQ